MSSRTTMTLTAAKRVSAKSNKKPKYNNTAVSQRKRLLQVLRENKGKGVSTFFSREVLGICHISARILELRKAGFEIITDWTYEPDANHVIHRIGLFKLVKEVK